jgi:hypothetical protein
MKTLLRASLLVIPFFAVPSLARATFLPSCQFEAGFGCRFNNTGMKGGCGGCVAGPWYSYFPYNAYFQTPAPVFGWPYLPPQPATPVPAPQVPPPQANGKEPKMPQQPQPQPQQPQPQSRYFPPREVQPVGYFAPAPSYWYGR